MRTPLPMLSIIALVIGTCIAPALAQQTAPTAQQERMKSCNAEAKAENLKGDARKSFMSDCLSGKSAGAGTTSQQGAAPAPAPAQQPPPSRQAAPRAATAGAGTSAGQFASQADAQRHCPGDTVVWANTSSHIYHFAGNKNYGNTKEGAYMCRKDSDSSGFRPAKNEKAPQ